MFHNRGGQSLVIGEEDYSIEVNLPPEGKVWNFHSQKLEDAHIIKRSEIKSEQYWEAVKLPDKYREKRFAEVNKQKLEPFYVDPTLESFRQVEWHRRLYGTWFWNNGKLCYITGTYYLFLTYWVLDDGLPEFRMPDRDFFYAWNWNEENPDSGGMLLLTKRRQGKTAKSGVIMFDRTSKVRRVRGGIQSKTEDDARDIVFFNGVVMPFLYMVDFFVPKFDKGREWPPKDKIRFFAQGQRGKEVEAEFLDFDNPKYLESWIDFKNSKEKAYDGAKLFFYIGDEVAKTTNVNVHKRHYIVRKALLDRDGYTIKGKALYTTTVEDMDSTADYFRSLWDESEIVKGKQRTKSWLTRWFIPAYKTIYFDKYGYPDEEKAKLFYMGERDALRDSPHALASEIRQNPFVWKEAFRSDGDDCQYNPIIIENRLEELLWRKGIYKRGKLRWVDEKRTEVEFVEDANGRFYVFAGPDIPNNVRFSPTGVPKPLGISEHIIGIDPFDHVRTKSGKFSNGAAAVYKRGRESADSNGNNFVCIYVGRPHHPYVFYEDMMMLCHWYGCQMLFEDQKTGIRHYFEMENQYWEFMMKNDKGEVGISASTKTHIDLIEATDIFITENGHRVMFPQLLTDWKAFNPNNTEKFDLGMASGYALIGDKRLKTRQDKMLKRVKTGLKLKDLKRI